MKEMDHLYHGEHFTIANKRYFIQVRTCLHGYDTRALQPMIHAHSEAKTSAACPLCFKVNNYLSKHFGHGTIEGDRVFLPLYHILRAFGQSCHCCPRDWYRSKELLGPDDAIDVGVPPELIRPRAVYDNRAICRALESCEISEDRFRAARARLCNDDNILEWFHGDDLPFVYLRDHIYYAHLDFREHIPYVRATNEEYLAQGAQATNSHSSTVDGIYGTWLFALWQHANISTQVCWDPFHTLLNISKYVILIWKNKRPVTQAAKDYSKLTSTHPDLFTPGDRVPWILPEAMRKQIENAIVDCIIIPSGYTQHFQMRKLFLQTGQLNGTAKIQVTTTLAEFIVWHIRKLDPAYASSYLGYHLLLSRDFQLLQRPSFTDGDIDTMQNKVNELVSLRQGLYPPSFSHIVYHQLVDIVPFIKQFGPIRGWWTLPMERLLSVVKRGLPQGGASHWITMMRRHVDQEFNKIDLAYDFTLSNDPAVPSVIAAHSLLAKGLKKGNIFLQDGRMQATDRAIMLRKRRKNSSVSFDGIEKVRLIRVLLDQVEHITGKSLGDMLSQSCLYRLYSAAGAHANLKFFNAYLGRGLKDFTEWQQLIVQFGGKFHEEGYIINQVVPIDDHEQLIADSNRGILYFSDFVQLREFWRQPLATHEFQQAIIYGIHFRSRGVLCREALQSDVTLREVNDLQLHFTKQKHNSSWCRFACTRDDGTQDDDKVGQLNFFFRIHVPGGSEPLLNNIPLASAVVRDPEVVTVRLDSGFDNVGPFDYKTLNLRIKCGERLDEQSYNSAVRFIPLTRVYSTAIATAPMEAYTNLPLLEKDILSGAKRLGSLNFINLHNQRVSSVQFERNKMQQLFHNGDIDDECGLPLSIEE